MKDENKTGVYEIVHIASGKRYIGSASRSFGERWKQHIRKLNKSSHHSVLLQRAWNKYGPVAFEFRILEITAPQHAVAVEQTFIDAWNTSNKKNGYNICRNAGSMLGYCHSAETIKKLSHVQLKRYQDPVEIEKNRKGQLKRFSDPEQVEMNRQRSLKQFSDPANVEKMRQIQLKRYEDPNLIERIRQTSLKQSSDPANIDKASKAAKRRFQNQSEIEKARQRGVKRFEDSLNVEKARLAAIALNADPARKSARVAKMNATRAANIAANPECLKKRIEVQKAIHADPVRKAAAISKRNATIAANKLARIKEPS